LTNKSVYLGNNGTMGRPKFTSKTAPTPLMITTHLIHPSIHRPHSPSKSASGSNQTFCQSILSGLTYQPTHRPTDGLGDAHYVDKERCAKNWQIKQKAANAAYMFDMLCS